jgi:hypothetical protein
MVDGGSESVSRSPKSSSVQCSCCGRLFLWGRPSHSRSHSHSKRPAAFPHSLSYSSIFFLSFRLIIHRLANRTHRTESLCTYQVVTRLPSASAGIISKFCSCALYLVLLYPGNATHPSVSPPKRLATIPSSVPPINKHLSPSFQYYNLLTTAPKRTTEPLLLHRK